MDEKQVWMYGGGVQSCAIAALICQGKIPVPDVAVISDTGREQESTWDYLGVVVAPALARIGLEIEVVPASLRRVDLYAGNGDLLLPVFSTQSGAVSKLPTFCSGEWKRDTLNRYLSAKGIPPRHRITWLGFSLDEANRIRRLNRSQSGKHWKKVRFPLVDDVPMNRGSCIATVEAMGWPTPPRSACWMCPNMRHDEWQDLKENSPDEFAKAVDLERKLRVRDPHVFFHRSCKPLGEVDFEREPDLFNRPCDSGLCFV